MAESSCVEISEHLSVGGREFGICLAIQASQDGASDEQYVPLEDVLIALSFSFTSWNSDQSLLLILSDFLGSKLEAIENLDKLGK